MSLASLAASRGTTLDRLAADLGIETEFLERCDSGWQPLPLHFVPALAGALGVDPNEVRHEVPRLTTCERRTNGLLVAMASRTSLHPRPLPIDRHARSAVLAKTVPVPPVIIS